MGWIADLLKEIPSAARYKAELEEMERENAELKQRVVSLESENKDLRQEIQRRDNVIQKEKSHDDILKVSRMQWGCITFPPDKKLYCPACFHTKSIKIETSRVDIHNRYCAVCKTKIPSG